MGRTGNGEGEEGGGWGKGEERREQRDGNEGEWRGRRGKGKREGQLREGEGKGVEEMDRREGEGRGEEMRRMKKKPPLGLQLPLLYNVGYLIQRHCANSEEVADNSTRPKVRNSNHFPKTIPQGVAKRHPVLSNTG